MQPDDNNESLIGTSAAIRAIEAAVETAARTDAKVLITGETGVGKEVAAQLIHRRSARSQKPLITLNCAGVPESLLESELFGHVRGSFTGAHKDRRGLLEMAANGTMFLDEVGEMSLRMQAVLLRFLQSGEIQRVGADSPHTRVNVRLISATNRDLRAQMADGEFREDFYFRLNVVGIHIPPLRQRSEDIPLLARHFVEQLRRQHRVLATLSPEILDILGRYHWPGNVRELRNVLERALVRARGPVLTPADLPPQVVAGAPAGALASAMEPDQQQTAGGTTPSRVADLAVRMMVHGQSFWSVVPPELSANRMDRDNLKSLIELGLERTRGNYRDLLPLFNIPADDNGRFLGFLQEHGCPLPRQNLRATPRVSRPRTTAVGGGKT